MATYVVLFLPLVFILVILIIQQAQTANNNHVFRKLMKSNELYRSEFEYMEYTII